jgi:O-antigen ligase
VIEATLTQRTGGASVALALRRVAALDGERVAVVSTAAAIATLPLLVPQGPGHTAPADALILFALGASLVWAGTSGRRLRFVYAIPMAVFIAAGALGALAGPVPVAGIVALLQDVLLLAWCWVVINVASSAQRLRLLLRTWVYSSIVWAVVLFAGLATGSTALTGQTARNASRTSLTLVDPSIAANYYLISIMIIWASRYPRRRRSRLAAYALLIAAMFTTGSNSGATSIIVATSVAGVVGIYRRLGAAPAVSALAFLVLAGALIGSSVSLSAIEERAHDSRYRFVREGLGRGEKSLGQRDTLLHEGLTLYYAGGPLGTGPASTKTRLDAEMAPFVKEAHDDYLAALVERGALGFVGLVLLFASVGLRSVSIARTQLGDAFAGVVIRPHALMGAVAGSMVTAAVYELLHVRHVWTLFALVAAISVWGRRDGS